LISFAPRFGEVTNRTRNIRNRSSGFHLNLSHQPPR
jgi:hypothetical protein